MGFLAIKGKRKLSMIPRFSLKTGGDRTTAKDRKCRREADGEKQV